MTAVVLLSGGLDSATALAIARARGDECHTLALDYGQRHRAEHLRPREREAEENRVARRHVRDRNSVAAALRHRDARVGERRAANSADVDSELAMLDGAERRRDASCRAKLRAGELADWILADRLPVRLQVQLHKVLWGDVRGR